MSILYLPIFMFHVHVQGPLFSPFPALHSHKLLYNKPINILLVIILDLEMFYQQLMNYISPKILSQFVPASKDISHILIMSWI
ncbi:hypothetical protein GLYMA_12G105100v4 [Glycine max]|uniref:Uncharacterized protein n=1 Tax=Glycine max TaxID=3847 RepID=K7LU29_SOYBN|nr:hypothetical protein GYH30_033318 [Glycine max]KRH25465.1 hypothetical protein GLYMA_12G105100v4 [Glycine max]